MYLAHGWGKYFKMLATSDPISNCLVHCSIRLTLFLGVSSCILKKKITLGYRHEFEQTSGDCEGQGSLMCCSQWGCKESEMTEQ